MEDGGVKIISGKNKYQYYTVSQATAAHNVADLIKFDLACSTVLMAGMHGVAMLALSTAVPITLPIVAASAGIVAVSAPIASALKAREKYDKKH